MKICILNKAGYQINGTLILYDDIEHNIFSYEINHHYLLLQTDAEPQKDDMFKP